MHDPGSVRGGEPFGRLPGNLVGRLKRQRALFDALVERFALQVRHHEELLLFLGVNLVDGADVRMVQRGSRLRLALEALDCLAVGGEVLGQELQRDHSLEAGVLRLEDRAHAAGTDWLKDAIARSGPVFHALTGPGYCGVGQWP